MPLGFRNVAIRKRQIEILGHGEVVQEMELLEDESNITFVERRPFLRREPVNRVI